MTPLILIWEKQKWLHLQPAHQARLHLHPEGQNPIKKGHHEHSIHHPSRNLADYRWHNIARQYWHPIHHIHRQHHHRHCQEPRIAVFYHVLHSASHFRTSY